MLAFIKGSRPKLEPGLGPRSVLSPPRAPVQNGRWHLQTGRPPRPPLSVRPRGASGILSKGKKQLLGRGAVCMDFGGTARPARPTQDAFLVRHGFKIRSKLDGQGGIFQMMRAGQWSPSKAKYTTGPQDHTWRLQQALQEEASSTEAF